MINKKVTNAMLILSVMTGGSYIYFANTPVEYAEQTNPPLKKISNNVLIDHIQKYEKVINDISIKLHENYGLIYDSGILPNEKIELIIKIPEKVEKTTSQKIKKITTDVIKQNKLDPNTFQISVENYYETTKNSSVRLSYNDVTGFILDEMSEKEYGAFSINNEVTPENINININLTEEKTKKDKKEVQKIARNIIKQKGFNPDLFQINVTNTIIIE